MIKYGVKCDFCLKEAHLIVGLTQGFKLHYLRLCLDCYYKFYLKDTGDTQTLFSLRSPQATLH